MVDLSVVILTYNEELNIDACLSKIKTLTDNVFIIDSYSSDRTLEICKTHNCKIYQNKFINHANQLNWALDNIDFTTEWILRIDADEYLTNDLINEIKQKLPLLEKESLNG